MTTQNKFMNTHYNSEQIRAITEWGNNILVSASAGSGKTSVLIERILFHIEERGFDIEDLLVVTFTDAAANEMKERLEHRLKDAVNKTENQDSKIFYIEQINKLSMAHIRTLHSFCLHVIDNFFYINNFNPSFQLLTDETQLYLMKEKIWHQLIDNIEDNPTEMLISSEEYFSLLQIFSDPRNDSDLFDMMVEIITYASSHTEPELWLENISQSQLSLEELIETPIFQKNIMINIKNQLNICKTYLNQGRSIILNLEKNNRLRYLPIIENEIENINQLTQILFENSFEDFVNYCQNISFANWPGNRKSEKNLDFDAINLAKDWRENAKKIILSFQNTFKYPYGLMVEVEDNNKQTLSNIGNLALQFYRDIQEYKSEKSIIDYNDLEHLTLDILAPYHKYEKKRVPSTAAHYYQDLFKEVMVDEYQDINDIQAKILSYLSHENDQEKQGNLFMVGDVKQSIYGFRMAEPSLFLTKYNQFQNSHEGHLIILDKNYRSRHEILQFTNFIFERIMDRKFGEMNYGINEALVTGNHTFIPQYPAEDFNIDLLLYCNEDIDEEIIQNDSDASIGDSIEGEAHLVAQSIIKLFKENKMIFDKKMNNLRPIEYSDIVILSSTKKSFTSIQRIFEEYKIPIFSQKLENYFQRQEIQVMVALLKIIDNPFQDIPLVAVLRSYFVGLTDDELSQIRINCPQGDFYSALIQYLKDDKVSLELKNKLQNFHNKLLSWQEYSLNHSLVDLIWTIYIETQYLEYNAALNNGVQRQTNLHALYERAREFEMSQFKGLAAFIRYIEKVMEQDKDLAEPVLLNEDENYVRLMTVHASKGLEFPIVYLININKRFNLQDIKKSYITSKENGLATDYYQIENKLKFDSLRKKVFKINKENQLKAEEMRKLYVALTRCEQKLYLVGTISSETKWQNENESYRILIDKTDLLVPVSLRREAKSWLEWIQLSLLIDNHNDSVADFSTHQINVQFFTDQNLKEFYVKSNFLKQIQSKESWLDDNLNKMSLVRTSSFIDQILNSQYPFLKSSLTSSYQSVTELKRLYEEPSVEKSDYYTNWSINHPKNKKNESVGLRYLRENYIKPSFIKQDKKVINYSEIGSLTHFILQTLDFSKFAPLTQEKYEEELYQQVKYVENKHSLDPEAINNINISNILIFIKSDLGSLLINNYNNLSREFAFSYLVPANQIFRDEADLKEDKLLIHGVIDAFIETEEEIILIDFKTDRFHNYGNTSKKEQINNLINKYRFQLSLYAAAVSQAKGKKVNSVFLSLLDFHYNIQLTDLIPF